MSKHVKYWKIYNGVNNCVRIGTKCFLGHLSMLGLTALTGAILAPAQADDTWTNEMIESQMKGGQSEAGAVRSRPVHVASRFAGEEASYDAYEASPPVAPRASQTQRLRRAVTQEDESPTRRRSSSKRRLASLSHHLPDAPSPVTRPGGSTEQVKSALPAEEPSRPVRRRPPSRARVASLGPNIPTPAPTSPSLTSGSINWLASSSCLNSRLRHVVAEVASNFGQLRVNSTCRSPRHNAQVGGARKSYHLTGNAVDFRVFGNIGATYAFLRGNRSVGGLKHYGGGLFHIDTGPRRSW
jgi:hypothetical protein